MITTIDGYHIESLGPTPALLERWRLVHHGTGSMSYVGFSRQSGEPSCQTCPRECRHVELVQRARAGQAALGPCAGS